MIRADSGTMTRVIYVVRHAAPAGEANNLTAAGVAWAEELKQVPGLVDVGKIFITNTNRTKNTVKPLAEIEGLSNPWRK